MRSLPVFLRLEGRPVILVGDGEAADAKRRLIERAGGVIVDESGSGAIAIVALDDASEAEAAIARLKARGILVNAVDRPALCDFTMPAIVDRAPLLVAIGTGGASAGLAKAVRQRLEAALPAGLGRIAERLHAARAALRSRFPDAVDRRRAIDGALAGLDEDRVTAWLVDPDAPASPTRRRIALRSPDPDDLTLAEARWLAGADVVVHAADIPAAVLDRARADARRTTHLGSAEGAVVELRWAD